MHKRQEVTNLKEVGVKKEQTKVRSVAKKTWKITKTCYMTTAEQ